jgi:hypothetical protein
MSNIVLRAVACFAFFGMLASAVDAAAAPPENTKPHADTAAPFAFDFGSQPARSGFEGELLTTLYSDERRYGFEPGATIRSVENVRHEGFVSGGCASNEPSRTR